MAMAKRQRREKVPENGTKGNPRTQVRTSGDPGEFHGQRSLMNYSPWSR